MRDSRGVAEVVAWIRAQPFLPDHERRPSRRSRGDCECRPCQRTRFWPEDGLNCWEATIHFTAAVQVHGLAPGVSLHLFDVQARGQDLPLGEGLVLSRGSRHVYPALAVGELPPRLVNLTSLAGRRERDEPLAIANAVTTVQPVLIRGRVA